MSSRQSRGGRKHSTRGRPGAITCGLADTAVSPRVRLSGGSMPHAAGRRRRFVRGEPLEAGVARSTRCGLAALGRYSARP